MGTASAQGIYAVVENGTIRAKLGESGAENSQPAAGRFVVEDVKTGQPLMFGPTIDLVGVGSSVPVPGSFVTVRIDGGAENPGAGGRDLIFGDTIAGVCGWIQPPTNLSNRILARWATIPATTGINPLPAIEVTCEITLVHDLAVFKFTVYNGIQDTVPPVVGSGTHTVGLRFAQNYAPPGFSNEGPVFLSNGGQVCTETTLTGSQVPGSWRVFDAQFQDSTGAVLFPPSPDPNNPSFIPPDVLIFGSATIMSETWAHTNINLPNFNFCTDYWDAAAAIYWNPRSYAPSQSGVYLTYFGKNHSAIDFSNPFGAGTDAPFALTFDPTKPVGSQLSPNPLTITAFVTNTKNGPLTNVTAFLTLPVGLKLAAGEQASKSGGTVTAGGEAQFSWNVVPDGTASGRLTYSVTFSAGPGTLGKTVTRTIDIPALPTQTLQAGLQMVSFPYILDDPTPVTALGLSQIDFDLLRWNPVQQVYEAVTQIVPGQGYWLRLASGKTFTLQGARPVPISTGGYEIRLKKGWNQIGNPYLNAVRWADVRVTNSDSSDPDAGTQLLVDEAAQRGLILPVLYRYDVAEGIYRYDQDNTAELVPFQGYWIKALRDDISLVIPPYTGRAARVTTKASSGLSAKGWSIRLMATSKSSSDTWNFIGMSAGSNDGIDLKDYEKPPAIKDSISLGITHPEWGGRAGVYTQDIRAYGGRKEWNVQVTSPTPNTDVTLAWPEISKLPRGYELFITDLSNGQRKAMRQMPSLHTNTGATGSRAFVISAEPRSNAGALILGGTVQGTQSGGGRSAASARIAVTSTQDATINVRVLDGTGQLVRQLVSGRAASSQGQTTFVWDYKNTKGSSLPSGVYNIEINGTTPDGQTAKTIIPHTIVR